MTEKPDNPQDHKHSDYEHAAILGILAIAIALWAAIMTVIASCGTGEDIEDLKERYCELAPDADEACKVVPR